MGFKCLPYADCLLSNYDEIWKVITFSLKFDSVDFDIKDDTRNKVCFNYRVRIESGEAMIRKVPIV